MVRDGDDSLVQISGPCVFTKFNVTIELTPAQYDSLVAGANLCDQIGTLQMEFLISGTSPENSMATFGHSQEFLDVLFQGNYKDDTSYAYVTNATSKSVAYYTIIYLNDYCKNLAQANTLRAKLRRLPSDLRRFDVSEIVEVMAEHSLYFIELFTDIYNDYERFLASMVDDRFRRIFKFDRDRASVLGKFQRKVFHTNLDCPLIRNDYDEEVFHINTGVFKETMARQQRRIYKIEKEYLEQLKMRNCKTCARSLN